MKFFIIITVKNNFEFNDKLILIDIIKNEIKINIHTNF